MAKFVSDKGVHPAELFDVFDVLGAELLRYNRPASPPSDDWRIDAYVRACTMIAAEAGWTLAELSNFCSDS